MWFLYILIIILFILLIIKTSRNNTIINSSYRVAPSNINYGGNGLFAEKHYRQGDTIDVCTTIKVINTDINSTSRLHDYVFESSFDEGYVLMPLGYCGVMNHSDTKQNASWKISSDDKYITMYAIRDIQKGEEFFVNYGNEYWRDRDTEKF